MDNKMTEAALKNIKTNSEKSQSETLNKTGIPISWVSALFAKFQVRYGHKWVSVIEGIEETAVTEWSQGLAGLTGEQIKFGLDNLTDDWPPSLPTFRNACTGKGINEFGLDYIPECYREKKRERLIESDENKEKHRAAYSVGMGGLKDILKK